MTPSKLAPFLFAILLSFGALPAGAETFHGVRNEKCAATAEEAKAQIFERLGADRKICDGIGGAAQVGGWSCHAGAGGCPKGKVRCNTQYRCAHSVSANSEDGGAVPAGSPVGAPVGTATGRPLPGAAFPTHPPTPFPTKPPVIATPFPTAPPAATPTAAIPPVTAPPISMPTTAVAPAPAAPTPAAPTPAAPTSVVPTFAAPTFPAPTFPAPTSNGGAIPNPAVSFKPKVLTP